MKHIAAALKVGILVLVVSVAGYYAFKSVSEQASGPDGYMLWGHFRDASGLPNKSRVVIAGLPIGEIVGRSLDGRQAKIEIRIRKGTPVWSNAAIYKKSSSLLGEFYLEIDPGTPESVDASGNVVKNTLLEEGDEIETVVEANGPEELMRKVSETLPRVDEVLIEVRGLAADARKLVNGPVASMAANLEGAVREDAELVRSILERTDKVVASIDRIAADVEKVTNGSDRRVDTILDNVETTSVELKELIQMAKGEVGATGEAVRAKLDRIDTALASTEQAMANTAEITRKVNEDKGTLGRLVNSPVVGDNLESITTDVAGFVSSAFGIQTTVGVRAEYNVLSEAVKSYFSVELAPRPDKFYLVELVKDPRGEITETYVLDPASGQLVRATTVTEELRFSFQIAKRIDRYTFRIGIKESTGGVGTDVDFFDGKLRLQADLFDFDFDELPRLKVMGAYQFFRYIYVYAGIDDALNDSREIAINNPTITGKTEAYHFGRDVFGGAMLRFDDADLKSLLFIGGSAIAGLASN